MIYKKKKKKERARLDVRKGLRRGRGHLIVARVL